MEIKADVRSIERLKDFFFVVPDYQREYVWKADGEVEQFLDDIDNEYDPALDPVPSYFIGSAIIVDKGGKFDVIDGQQRLTTIVLSLCVLRDLLSGCALTDKQAHYLDTIKQWLMNFDVSSDETQVRLELQYEESKDFLTKLITGQPYEGEVTGSIKRMKAAHARIHDHFQRVLKEGLDALVKYTRYFLTRVELVLIQTENISGALKIFETINQRGAGLNAMDLVKNLLFSEADEADFDRIKITWKKLTAHLEECGEGQTPLRFLRYFLVGRYHNGILREDEIYKWIISAEGKKALQYQAGPVELAHEMESMAARYSALVRATEYQKDGSPFPHVSHIGFINKYRSRQHLVLLLALPKGVKDELLDYLGCQMESFLFFSNTLGIQGRNNERLFAQWAPSLRGADDLAKVDAALKNTMLPYLRERVPEFRTAFPLVTISAFNPGYRQRFILGRLENTMRVMAGMNQHGQEFIQHLQIEHILPQTPRGGILPKEFQDIEAYRAAVGRLGNVTLLESMINQAVNNINDMTADWFAMKCNEYVKSNLVMTDLLDADYKIGKDTALNRLRDESGYTFEVWNNESVGRRQRVLMNVAFQTWTFCGARLDIADP